MEKYYQKKKLIKKFQNGDESKLLNNIEAIKQYII